MGLNSEPKTLFICGFGRPSMQYMHALFDGHSQILQIPVVLKFHLFWPRVVPPGTAPAQVADRWLAVSNLQRELEEARGDRERTPVVDVERFTREFRERCASSDGSRRAAFLAIHDAWAMATGLGAAERVIVENAHSVAVLDEIHADFPGARFLVMTREPASALASCLRHYDRPAFSDPGRFYVDLLGCGFALLNQARQRFGADRLLVVAGEQVVRAPEQEMRRIAGWAGLPFEPGMALPTKAGRPWSNRRPSPRGIEIGSAKAADGYLWTHEQALLDWVCGPVAAQFGYPRASVGWYRNAGPLLTLLPNRLQLLPNAKDRVIPMSGPPDRPWVRRLWERFPWVIELGRHLSAGLRNFGGACGRFASLVLLVDRVRWVPDLYRYRAGRPSSAPYFRRPSMWRRHSG